MDSSVRFQEARFYPRGRSNVNRQASESSRKLPVLALRYHDTSLKDAAARDIELDRVVQKFELGRQRREDEVDARLQRLMSGVDCKTFPFPRIVIALCHGIPIRQGEAGYIARPGLNPASMLGQIAADDLQPKHFGSGSPASLRPTVAGLSRVVHAISDRVVAKPEVIERDRLSGAVGPIPKVAWRGARRPDRLIH
jgi:hypothetical protein